MVVDRVTTYKIYVGNLPDNAQDEDIRKIFEEFGTVVQCERVGKKAFVHMEDDIEGTHAVGELQGRELDGTVLVIQESKKNELPRVPTVKLLVKNISPTIDARSLRNMFKRFGYVVEVQIENGEGHVCLEAIGDIRSAINDMNGYKIDEMEMTVEPDPTPAKSAETTADKTSDSDFSNSSPKKKQMPNLKNKGYTSYTSSWSRARQEFYKSAECGEDYESYDYGDQGHESYSHHDSPWMHPPHSPFDSQPERILRDPHAHLRPPRGNPRGRGLRGFGKHPVLGPPPRVLPPPPSYFPAPSGPPRGGMGTRIMRSGNQPRGFPSRGGPRPSFQNDSYAEPPFYHRDEPVNRNNMFEQMGNEVEFYEDEPISSISRGMLQPKRAISGANSIPVGNMPRGSFQRNLPQRNGNGRARGGGQRGSQRGTQPGRWGRGKPQFTAVTEEVGPGEKYPVPPMHNPVFRAPLKRSKEEVKRKVKKKKRPLVPAELPDYSVPVPRLPDPTVPKGAVLKPFPPPQGHSLIDSDTFGGGSGSASFFHKDDQNNSGSQMDFTMDDIV